MSNLFIAFLQALGLVVYCGLVGLVFWQGEHWFGPMANFWGPVFLLLLFVASVLISSLIGLGYPIILFWEKKQRVEALKLVVATAAWLALFVLVIVLILVVS